jgi:hypothetical protein
MKKFVVTCNNDHFWHIHELLKFLKDHEHQDIELTITPEAIALEPLGLYKLLDLFEFRSVQIHTYNPFEHHDVYNIQCGPTLMFLNQRARIDPELHAWNKSKVFMTLYGRPTASRLALASYLYSNYRDQSHLHFSYTKSHDHLQLYELNKLLEYKLELIEPAGKMISCMPLTISSTEFYTPTGYKFDVEKNLTRCYQDIFIDIVGETHVKGSTFFPTEKTTRPILLKKPFIIFASVDYLDYLHQLGFRTFSDFWSEDYDGYEGRERLERILKVIDSIASKSTQELESMYWDMQYTLDHNYKLLQTQTYQKSITKL